MEEDEDDSDHSDNSSIGFGPGLLFSALIHAALRERIDEDQDEIEMEEI